MASDDIFNYINDLYSLLPEQDVLRFGELWKAYEQTLGDIWTRLLQSQLSCINANLPSYNIKRWLNHEFDTTTQVNLTASFTTTVDISGTIDLSERNLINFSVDNGPAVQVSIDGLIPSATTIEEIILAVNTAVGFTFAAAVYSNSLIKFTSPVSGPASSITFYPATVTGADASAIVLGLGPAQLPLTIPQFPYTYQLVDSTIVSIPTLQNKIRDESVTVTLTEGVDYQIVFGSGLISFNSPPALSMGLPVAPGVGTITAVTNTQIALTYTIPPMVSKQAESVPLNEGYTTILVTLPLPMSSTNYSVVCTMENTTDPSPQFQPVVVTALYDTGFQVSWNAPLDSGNYSLNYSASAATSQLDQSTPISLGATSVDVVFNPALPSSDYTVVCTMENLVDLSPEFQPVVVTAATENGFTVSWNSPIDTHNYLLNYAVTQFVASTDQSAPLASGITSIFVPFITDLSTTNYLVLSTMENLIDPNPQFQPVTVTYVTTSGFVVSWSDPTDSANYFINYSVFSLVTVASATYPIPPGTTPIVTVGQAVVFNQPLVNANMWAKNTLYNFETPYNNFGYMMNFYAPNTTDYLKIVKGLWFAYWTGPSPQNIQRSLYLLLELPTASKGGTVTSVTGTSITLTYNDSTVESFDIPAGLAAIVVPGQTLTQYQPLVTGVNVYDKVNSPGFVAREIGRSGIGAFLTQYATTGTGPLTDETIALTTVEQNTYLPFIDANALANATISVATIKTFLTNLQPKSRTFQSRTLSIELPVGNFFVDSFTAYDALQTELIFDAAPSVDFNPNTLAEQSDLTDAETDPSTGISLDGEVLNWTDYIDIVANLHVASTGQAVTPHTFEDSVGTPFANAKVGYSIVIASGADAGTYPITTVTDNNHVQVSGTLPSSLTGISYSLQQVLHCEG